MKVFVVSMVALLAGCANPGIVKLSPDTYLISREDHAGIFGNMARLKADVITEANTFAAAQGKVAIPINALEKPVGNTPGSWARFDYQFRVVDKDDREVRRTELAPRPDIVIEKIERTPPRSPRAGDADKPKDLYLELMKLDDLRKRGILSEAEFETQKKKLLGAP